MCYDVRMSIIAFVINIVSVIFLLHFSKKSSPKEKSQLMIISYFLLYVGVMQFWDAVFWLNDADTLVNKYATKAAMIWINLEPIILFLLIWLINGKVKTPSIIIIGIYTIVSIIYSESIFSKLGGTKPTEQSGDSLDWKWTKFKFSDPFYILFLATLILLTYFELDGWIRNLSIFLIISTFLFSVYKYRIKMTIGRFWCYIGAFLPIIYLIKLMYKKD